ncbi:MAG TPA: SigE family RNA polymerase sigma factor [Solirubrobacteraceae bacterium]|nr:SigE family RNA polymerase sigma factor [Solirubrobacteraceae bacterium]
MRIRPAPNRPRPSQRARADFEQFVTASSDALLRTAYLVAWDPVEAEDLVQECLLAVARRWPRVRRMDHPHAYARRVLINLALDGARRRTRHRQELVGDDAATLAAAPDESSARRLHAVGVRAELIEALGTLPPRQRAVLVLRYFEDLSEAQVAELLGCSVGTVKSTASRALARLQATLTPDISLSTKEHTR